jgi:hypothetical protein
MRNIYTSDTRFLDIDGLGLNPLPDTQTIQDTSHIRRELDARAYEAQVRCGLVDVDVLEALFG